MINEIERNLLTIKNKISTACKIYNKDLNSIKLIAVSKNCEEEKIINAIKFECKFFGENYIQEAKEKWQKIKPKFPDIKLHFIGHLQSNKAKDAVELFDVIETVDNEKLAKEIAKQTLKLQKNPEIFIQVNIGEEPQKSGIMPNEVKNFAKLCIEELKLNIVGLMCIPPGNELASPYFALLAKMAKEIGLKQLSMGMSSDFEEAIATGSTQIRIGTAIFGARI